MRKVRYVLWEPSRPLASNHHEYVDIPDRYQITHSFILRIASLLWEVVAATPANRVLCSIWYVLYVSARPKVDLFAEPLTKIVTRKKNYIIFSSIQNQMFDKESKIRFGQRFHASKTKDSVAHYYTYTNLSLLCRFIKGFWMNAGCPSIGEKKRSLGKEA